MMVLRERSEILQMRMSAWEVTFVLRERLAGVSEGDSYASYKQLIYYLVNIRDTDKEIRMHKKNMRLDIICTVEQIPW